MLPAHTRSLASLTGIFLREAKEFPSLKRQNKLMLSSVFLAHIERETWTETFESFANYRIEVVKQNILVCMEFQNGAMRWCIMRACKRL